MKGFCIGIAYSTVWVTGWRTAVRSTWAGSLESSEHAHLYPFALVALLSLLAATKEPLTPTVLAGAALCRLASILLSSPILFFWGMAFTASLSQGIAHMASGEKATLMNLEEGSDKSQKVKFEWAHVVFFPTLLYHSIYQSGKDRVLFGWRPSLLVFPTPQRNM